MELIQVEKNTYYIKNFTNIGIYKINEKDIYLIDTGNDKDAGKKILKIIEEQNWNVIGIISTHSNADHIGGNKVIQDRTNAKIYSHGIEKVITEFPILEPSFLYGSKPYKELTNKFLCALPSNVLEIDGNLPDGLEYINLKGHFFDMIGIKTSDDIIFLADSLFSEETINKYHLFFIYDVEEYLNTLDYLNTLNAKLYIPSHCEATSDITNLININKNKINEISNVIIDYLKDKHTFEELLKYIFDKYNLVMNENQYVLISSTTKAYLTYLKEQNKVTYEFIDNIMYWKTINN